MNPWISQICHHGIVFFEKCVQMVPLMGSLSLWFIPQRIASCPCFANSCSWFTNSCLCFTWYPSKFSKARKGNIWTHFSQKISPWARLEWNPWISSNSDTKIIDLSDFVNSLIFKKTLTAGTIWTHFSKKTSPWWQISEINGFVKILKMILKQTLLTSLSCFFTNVHEFHKIS